LGYFLVSQISDRATIQENQTVKYAKSKQASRPCPEKIPDLEIFSSFTDFRQGNNAEEPSSEICLEQTTGQNREQPSSEISLEQTSITSMSRKNNRSWDIF
jgi:hypothetical protein